MQHAHLCAKRRRWQLAPSSFFWTECTRSLEIPRSSPRTLLPKAVGDSSFLTARARLLPQGGANSPLRLRLRLRPLMPPKGATLVEAEGRGRPPAYRPCKIANLN